MDTFVARQPIFDRSENVIAYELLFRSGPENFCNGLDADAASSSVISDSMHVFGRHELTGGKDAYVNVSRKTLLDGFPLLLPPQSTVVELLESVEPDADVVEACQRLKQSRYTLALDDFVFDPGFEALVPYVDIIKVDFTTTDREERRDLQRRYGPRGIRLLAEKVETREEFDEARALGYEYFQGYFICRPELLSRKGVSASRRNTLELIQELNRRDLDLEGLETVIQKDAALTLKLLRYLNSAYFARSARITSIMHALRMLGEGPLRTWASLVALGSLSDGKSSELMVTSLIRGRFCETAGARARSEYPGNELFLLGMISTFDALLDQPIEEVLAGMSVATELSDALTGRGGPLGPLYSLVRSLERGEWNEASAWSVELGLDDDDISRLYCEAVLWADRVQKA